MKKIVIVLSLAAVSTVPAALHAQTLLPVHDSTMTTTTAVTATTVPTKSGLSLSGMSYSGMGTSGSGYNNNFLKNIGSYKLNLSNGLSLKTQSLFSSGSAVSALNNPTNLRRENFLPREELLYGQHFSFGASYNGLNNMLKGGFGGSNGRNPGLSLHAGISF